MRVVHDSVHGTYYLHDLLWIIIDSPEFQRLRKIKQTGNTYRVYPGAVHSRFEHSLGTAYLCRLLCDKLRTNYLSPSELTTSMTNQDIMCLQIAALCHDLGHCAFSHLFDDVIIKRISSVSDFSHEAQSYLILKRIFEKNEDSFLAYDITIDEIQLIGKLIIGSEKKTPYSLKSELDWSNSTNKKFMFEIISNEATGIDVDKFDYIKRDCYHIGITCGFDSQRLMEFAYLKRNNDTGDIHLEYHLKGKEIIGEMWRSRTDLHRRAYRHRVVQVFDEMISEVFKLVAYDYIVYLPNGNTSTIKEAISDIDCYLSLTDNSLDKIYDYCIANTSKKPDIIRAKSIIENIESRNLWKVIAGVSSEEELEFKLEEDVIPSMSLIGDEYIYYFIVSDKYHSKTVETLINIKKQCDTANEIKRTSYIRSHKKGILN